jgi:hypothetical protein
LGRRIVHFPDETLLAWFHRHWVVAGELPGDRTESDWHDAAHARTEKIFHGGVYGFHKIWSAMMDRGSPPANVREMTEWLAGVGYPEGWLGAQPHALQIATDDDELDLAVLMFDDHFAEKHPDRVAYPLREVQALPENVKSRPAPFLWRGRMRDLRPARRGRGAVYLIFIVIHDTSWLIDLYGAFRIRGLRLPDLADYLRTVAPQILTPQEWKESWMPPGAWPEELRLLRWTALQAGAGADLGKILRAVDKLDPHRTVRRIQESRTVEQARTFLLGDPSACERDWRAVAKARAAKKSEWVHERRPTFVQASRHVAQLGFSETSHLPRYESSRHDQNTGWLFFDDLWAASHPDLARSLLWWANEQLPLFRER